MRWWAGVVGAAVIIGSAQAWAGEAPPPAQRSQGSASPSAGTVELSRRYLLASGQMEALRLDVLAASEALSRAPAPSDVSPSDLREMLDLRSAVVAQLLPELMEEVVLAYAQVYTAEELTELVRFWESPVGRSVTAKHASLDRKLRVASAEFRPRVLRELKSQACRRDPAGAACAVYSGVRGSL